MDLKLNLENKQFAIVDQNYLFGLEDQVKQLQKDIKERDELFSETCGVIGDRNKIIDDLKQELNKHENKEILNNLNGKIKDLKVLLEERDNKLDELYSQLNIKDKQCTEFEDFIEKLKYKNTILTEQGEYYLQDSSRIQKLQDEIDVLSEDNEKRKNVIDDLCDIIEGYEDEILTYETLIEIKNKDIDELEEELKESQEKNVDLYRKYNNVKNKLTTFGVLIIE